MIVAIEWVIGFCAYAVCGGIVGGFVAYVSRNGNFLDDYDRNMGVGVATALWPIAVFMIIAIATIRQSTRIGLRVGGAMGRARYATKIQTARGQMMASDLERVGGNFDLIVNYDYLPCARCYGGGCKHCHNEGVVRTKARA